MNNYDEILKALLMETLSKQGKGHKPVTSTSSHHFRMTMEPK
ncbi:hypothetical protein D047_1142 [Vibrio parahaemolyticus VPTS-2010_2]|nr:hypothetical protein D047_1142 [Vibrio parahaemolyticus VPTS-2010_2]